MSGRISQAQFSIEFEAWGRERGIPLKDILNFKEDLAVIAMHEKAQRGLESSERTLFAQFMAFKANFGQKLPPGTKPLQTGSDSE